MPALNDPRRVLPSWRRLAAVKSLLAKLLIVVMLSGVAASWAEPRPAILIDAWGATPDLDYMKRLEASGFEMDAIRHEELTWERLSQYNVLVLLDFPETGVVRHAPEGGPAKGPNLEETLLLLDRFLAAGGGVMINLVQHHNNPVFHNSMREALAKWDARRPVERVVLPSDRIVTHPRLRMPFYLTDNVQPSPVSEGIERIWYPLGGRYWFVAGPIDVDDDWTVVLRAPQGSRTEPIELPEPKPGVPRFDSPFVRPAGVEEPALFAIRDLQPGRLALFHAHPNFHLLSGLSWVHDGAMLDKGLGGRWRSDFDKLLGNTFRWLAAPSLQGEALGGAMSPPDRWAPPLEKPDNPNYVRMLLDQRPHDLDPDLPPPPINLHTGIIGPRTSYSGGTGTVADYAAAAREQGLSFIIFLEDMVELTAEKLAQLTADCREQSDDDLLLLPGYRGRSNLGNQIFFFGYDPLYVHDKHLSEDRQTIIIQPQDENGRYLRSPFIDFTFEFRPHGEMGPGVRAPKANNSIGFFDFTEPMKSGGMAVHDLRLFSMAGVVYYNRGQLVEDVTDQYLLTNAGTMPGTPVAINLVDSPAAMIAEVQADRALTYAVAPQVRDLWNHALSWNYQIVHRHAFPSSGPMIRHWPQYVYRSTAYAGEPFAVARMLITPWLQVTSDVGLQEVVIYEGDQLFRRFLPDGSKDFATRLFLSGSLQRNMSVVATDTAGGKAVSFPLRGWSEISPAPVFCGDHVNDCGSMKLFRGPGWSRHTNVPLVPDPGKMWDGMALIVQRPVFGWGQVNPTFTFGDGNNLQGNIGQTPVMELCDDRVWRGRTVSRGLVAPGGEPMNPWSGWGPIEPMPFVDLVGIYTEWAQYQTPTPTGWGPTGQAGGPTASSYRQETTFKEDLTLTQARLGYEWRKDLDANVMLVLGRGDRILKARDVAPQGEHVAPGVISWPIDTGDWLAAISPNQANSMLLVNLGVPLNVRVRPDQSMLSEAIPAGGIEVKTGERRVVEWFTCWWPMDRPIPDTDTLLRQVRYFQQPDGLDIRRGERLDAPPGVLELAAENHAVELVLPRPGDGLDPNLPFRVRGLNPRWSAILWQKTGYVGAGRYGPPENRFRNLATDFEGRVYFPVYTGQAPRHHLVVGQPVIADAAGRELFINIVCLKDAEEGQPPLWHVSVNNPTDAPITTTLTRSMDLPGLDWTEQTTTLQSGEHRILLHPSAAAD